jgi:hypothetical protein
MKFVPTLLPACHRSPLAIVLLRGIFLLLLNALAANTGTFAQAVTSNGYTVTGRITSSDQNVSFAHVAVTNTQTGQTVFTDERGIYTFTGLSAGRVYVYPQSKNVRFSPVVRTVMVGEQASIIPEFAAVEATYTIHGRVTAAHRQSQGVPNVTIATDNGRFATTDTDGLYALTGLPYGTTVTLIPQTQMSHSAGTSHAESLPARRTVTVRGTVTKQNFTLDVGIRNDEQRVYRLHLNTLASSQQAAAAPMQNIHE